MTSERHPITLADIPDAIERGGRLRTYCPIHGSDRQRSLSIQIDGDWKGWGTCHACGAVVVVEDIAKKLPRGPRSASLLRPRPAVARVATPADWQQEESLLLHSLCTRLQTALERSERVRAYLAERAIPLEIVLKAGIGYLPSSAIDAPDLRDKRRLLAKWVDRLVIPLASPDGVGYAGRSLRGWRSGMDENEHKTHLERLVEEQKARGERVTANRWEKTYPAGWFNFASMKQTPRVILCEGPFDALALMAAGAGNVVAVVGTAAQADWIPANVGEVMLALDGDGPGKEAAERLALDLRDAGIRVILCPPPADGQGKDWSERWRLHGAAGVAPVLDALANSPIADAPEAHQDGQQQEDLPQPVVSYEEACAAFEAATEASAPCEELERLWMAIEALEPETESATVADSPEPDQEFIRSLADNFNAQVAHIVPTSPEPDADWMGRLGGAASHVELPKLQGALSSRPYP